MIVSLYLNNYSLIHQRNVEERKENMERNRRLLEYLFHISLFFFFFSKRNYGNSTLKFHDS